MFCICITAVLSFIGAFVDGILIEDYSSNSQKHNVEYLKNQSETNDTILQRIRRDTQPDYYYQEEKAKTSTRRNSAFSDSETGWTRINEEVDIVIPQVLDHFDTLGITHLNLPEIKENLSVKPLFITYSASLWLFNGSSYQLAGISRYGDSLMTYKDKLFLCKFYLIINNLKFDYDFMLRIFAIEGYGKVSGSLEDTIIYAELSVDVEDTKLQMDSFQIVSFKHIRVELNYSRLIRELTGAILTPITNLFRDRITTSISDGLKEQIGAIMDDFNSDDPLELRKFTKNLLSGLTGLPKE